MLALIKVLNHEDKQVRRTAIWALGENICPEVKTAVPAVIAAFGDESSLVRRTAVKVLWKLGTDVKTVAPALIEALKDEKIFVRADAAEVLEKINTPEVQKALEEYKYALIKSLEDEDVMGSRRCCAGLGENKHIRSPKSPRSISEETQISSLKTKPSTLQNPLLSPCPELNPRLTS